ncbi:hypothetical protein D5S17_27750 [Pseudonocardiaceae bacterium YIM PH 21723]|nr:hypothetical protein D5S17_27750 [Pseudonocardiaceae bacterium YIM PH 21723]
MRHRFAIASTVAGLIMACVPPAAQAAPVVATMQATCAGRDSCVFVADRDYHAGDCTMFHGASWTLRTGRMVFEGTVTSSDDNDRWEMVVELLNEGGAVLGRVHNPDNLDERFVKQLPNNEDRYFWQAFGSFDNSWYQQTHTIQIRNKC